MHKTIAEAKAFVTSLAFVVRNLPMQVGLAVPYTLITPAADAARGTMIAIGAQNLAQAKEGAYTGEVSAPMIKDAGAGFVIIGHSERRRLFHETDNQIHDKVRLALDAGLKIVFCVGETAEERNEGNTFKVLEHQIAKGLNGLEKDLFSRVIVAYEPVWAIGTNQSATPELAEEAHLFCRNFIKGRYGPEVSQKLDILYGGSVKPENAAQLLDQLDIDGFLVGNASLQLESFTKIIQCQKSNSLQQDH